MGTNIKVMLTIFAATGGAHYMLRALDQPETFRRTVGVAN